MRAACRFVYMSPSGVSFDAQHNPNDSVSIMVEVMMPFTVTV